MRIEVLSYIVVGLLAEASAATSLVDRSRFPCRLAVKPSFVQADAQSRIAWEL